MVNQNPTESAPLKGKWTVGFYLIGLFHAMDIDFLTEMIDQFCILNFIRDTLDVRNNCIV